MARPGRKLIIKPDTHQEDDAGRLTALFKGRFSVQVAQALITDYGNVQSAASFLLLESPEEVGRWFQKNEEYIRRLREDSEKVINVLEARTEDCQFSCESCQRMWWKRVPVHKKVSKCYRCRQKYDPVPREHMWGWGEFLCPGCNKHFKGVGIMSQTRSICYTQGCNEEAEMIRVLPPKKQEDRKPTRNRHNCNGINCWMKGVFNQYGNQYEKPPVCIHPKSALPQEKTVIHYPSPVHLSTGSTLMTFLEQGSLDTGSKKMALSLETVDEQDEP